ncbi:transporter [Mesorhizobium sp. Root157]|uniref:DMT family transporter n=1 Tax=Mesorhizobium sp. Root157 TaxID=1736477 RepID=UPI0006FEF6DA|nr:DMT family transporter [Mesorhizobium sp. Root157]KQZ93227.1 transporter [Mesorhizobium sp. Root157]
MTIQSQLLPTPAAPSRAPNTRDRAFEPRDYGLYVLTVIAWSVSWFAIRLQVGTVSNEVNLVWRFAIATTLMIAWVVFSGRRIRFPLRDHARFAALGILMFSSNFLFFYYGAGYLVSGLLSVVFSLASVINIMLAAIALREQPSPRVLASGILGFCGIALMFAPEITAHGLSGGTMIGLGLCIAGTLCFCIGNQISAAGLRNGLPLVPMSAWGMVYGTLWSALLALLLGRPFIIEPTVSYLGSLLFLAVISTVIAFSAYLTLLSRIGPARAGYATVLFPIFALLVSTALEGYQWSGYAFAGLAFVAVGNVLVIRTGKP